MDDAVLTSGISCNNDDASSRDSREKFVYIPNGSSSQNLMNNSPIICQGCGKKFYRLRRHLKCSKDCAAQYDIAKLEKLFKKEKSVFVSERCV